VNAALPVADWLQILDDEYLRDFVPSGGSAVKFVSGRQHEFDRLASELTAGAERRRLLYASLDPARLLDSGRKPDLHLTERFFFAVTAPVDWKLFAERQARQYLLGQGIEVALDRPLSDLDDIARENGRSPDELRARFERDLVNRHLRDHQMGAEFRNAIFALVYRQLVPDTITPTTEDVLLGWFRGKTVPGGARALKRVQVYERITSANAWTMLQSFTHWLPSTGVRGAVVVLDFRPYEIVRAAQTQINAEAVRAIHEATERGASPDEIRRIVEEAQQRPPVLYSPQAYMRMLALLRRFIDSTAILERTLLVVFTSPDYYPSGSSGSGARRRTYFDYNALQTRIGQEVHDARRTNPYAALVHLGEGQ
jgi:hypothetical protein